MITPHTRLATHRHLPKHVGAAISRLTHGCLFLVQVTMAACLHVCLHAYDGSLSHVRETSLCACMHGLITEWWMPQSSCHASGSGPAVRYLHRSPRMSGPTTLHPYRHPGWPFCQVLSQTVVSIHNFCDLVLGTRAPYTNHLTPKGITRRTCESTQIAVPSDDHGLIRRAGALSGE